MLSIHIGGALSSDTVKLAHEFNYNFRYKLPRNIGQSFDDIISISGDDNVILSNVKRGEEDSAIKSNYSIKPKDEQSIVVRVYESLGGESFASLNTTLNLKRIEKIDNLEMKVYKSLTATRDESDHTINRIPIKLRPFEIASFRLHF